MNLLHNLKLILLEIIEKMKFSLYLSLQFSTVSPTSAPVYFSSSSGDSPNRKVRGERRRPGSSGEPTGRAEAPKREGRPSQAPPPTPPLQRPSQPSGSAAPSPLGGMLSGLGGGGAKMGGLSIVVILLLVICIGGYMLMNGGLSGGGESLPGLTMPEEQGEVSLPTQVPLQAEEQVYAVPTRSSTEFQGFGSPPGAPASKPGQTWTVMLYQDADDKILEKDIYIDLNEAELVGSSDKVNIVAQTDRYQGGYTGDGNWTSVKRFYLTQDSNLEQINSQEVMDLGEVNMGQTETLVDFATWAIENYPADKYVLILSDHGMGWPGGWTDKDPRGRIPSNVPLANNIGSALYLMDLENALAQIGQQSGIDAFELVGLDACLMGHMEVFTTLTPYARYAVASQEVEPSVGWAYAAFLKELVDNPDMDGAELSRHIVDSYIEEDQRIQNAQARADFAGKGFFTPTADQVIAQLEQGITLAAADLSLVPALLENLNDFAYQLQDADQRRVAQARNYAQPFTSIFGEQVPPSYIDLAHFAAILAKESGNQAIKQGADQLIQALQNVIIAEKSGSKKPGATGVSIYFPNSQLYGNPAAGPQSYNRVAELFAGVSLWDDFLNFHYTGSTFQKQVGTLAVPQRSVVAPGEGEITISEITLSNQEAAPDIPVLIAADIDGENIGYIYMFAGYFDQAANSINLTDMDFIQSDDTREVNGVFYPDWGDGPFTLEFEWEPLVFAVSDGEQTIPTMLEPVIYGADPEQAVYKVDGIYTYTDSEQRKAMMYFSNGEMTQVFGFNDSGAPREIVPEPGDEFTIQEQWLDLDSSGRVVDRVSEEGGTLVFSEQPFTWELLYAAPGEYVVGFIVEDLDGSRRESYAQITVR